ncbi:MAG: lipopolysaccharide transport periplasmic protein LptA [Betaproteobacteria bacterium]
MTKFSLRVSVIVTTVMSAMAFSVHAEKADRDQKANVSAVFAGWDDTSAAERVYRMEGDIVITQGTLRVTGERGLLHALADGRTIDLYGDGAKQVTFRQKREGEQDFVEAWADRGNYDERTGNIRLFSNVRFKSGGNTVTGEYLTYNSVTEKIQIRNKFPTDVEDLPSAAAAPKSPASTSGSVDGRIVFELAPPVTTTARPPASK